MMESKAFRQHFVIVIKYKTETWEENTLNDTIKNVYRFPDWIQSVCQNFESITLKTGEPTSYESKAFFLDDGYDEIIEDAKIKGVREIELKGEEQLPINKAIRKRLAIEFASMEEVILASKEELQSVDGIGEKTSTKIYDRYSQQTRNKIQSRSDSEDEIILIEDQNDVLRLPEEFESNSYSPSTPTI